MEQTEPIAGIGLILEGGGMRGIYTAGVLDCLMEEKIFFPTVYGVSAGACHACSYLSRQRGRAKRTITDFVRSRHYAGVYSLLSTGDFFGVRMIYNDIPNRLLPFDYDTYANAPESLIVTVTNCRTGQAEYLTAGDLRKDMILIRASSSLPMLSRPVKIGGEHYMDGGISDSIPLARSIADGNRKNLLVLTQHSGYRKQPTRLYRAMKPRFRARPQLVEAVKTRHLRYNEALDLIAREQAEDRAFVIQPKTPVTIGRLEKNPARLNALYEEGYRDAREQLEALGAFLRETK